MNTIHQVKENLASIHHVDDSNFDKLNLLCEEINHINKGIQPDTSLIRPLLDILEANPNYDFGMPGYMVHTLETYYKKGLEQELIGSIKRNPTLYTIWMLNRIINGTTNKKEQTCYLNILKEALQKNIPDYLRTQIQHLIDIHQ